MVGLLMAMTQTNSSWDQKLTVIKGNFGEAIVDNFLEKKGFICYFPKTKGAHWFDRVAIKDKKKIVVVEVKTKARLNKYPATGFDLRSYKEYKRVYEEHKIDVFVFFIDEMLKKIYGNFIRNLEAPVEIDGKKYPMQLNFGYQTTIVFPLTNMRHICDLTEDQCQFLKIHSNRSYQYIVD